MDVPSELTADVAHALYEALAHHGGGQLLLFGPGGKPLWAARTPLDHAELQALRSALAGIERLAQGHPRPFLSRHPSGKYVAAALDGDEDLYLLLFADLPTQAAAETRVAAARAALAGIAAQIRKARS